MHPNISKICQWLNRHPWATFIVIASAPALVLTMMNFVHDKMDELKMTSSQLVAYKKYNAERASVAIAQSAAEPSKYSVFFAKPKDRPYLLELDPNVSDALELSCNRDSGESLECVISSKMSVRASLLPLEFVCYKGDVMVKSTSLHDNIDAFGKRRYPLYCHNDFDRVVLRQQKKSY